jgi:hypothetical protein
MKHVASIAIVVLGLSAAVTANAQVVCRPGSCPPMVTFPNNNIQQPPPYNPYKDIERQQEIERQNALIRSQNQPKCTTLVTNPVTGQVVAVTKPCNSY